jgi:two-component system, NtrC family, sensor kinase
MEEAQHTPAALAGQSRPTVANLLVPLRVRLALLVALVVTFVVASATYLELRTFESSIGNDLVESAKSTAQSVADDLELRADPASERDEVADTLREFLEAVPSIRVLSVVTFDGEQAQVLASTSSAERPEAVAVARRAMTRNDPEFSGGNGLLRMVGVPVRHDDRVIGGVVATYSMASVEELRRRGRTVVLWFVPAAVLLLTALVDLATRRLIHRPLAGIRRTMQRIRSGELGARAPVLRNDEIGEMATGLNEMLAELENFNVALQDRVREATAELREKNVQLRESYERVIALREALARADQMAAVGNMAASVAHQIGTPLNLISGYVQVIREEEGPASKVTRRLEIVQEQIGKVTAIVRTMLDHARRPTPKEATDIGQLVERVCDVARPKLEAASVRLEVKVAAVPPVMADRVQLELALLNLVTNGLDAMPRGGVMAITVSNTDEGGVRIQVGDTGVGIPADLLPRVFEPWVTTKEAGRGTGLGLSITRDVVAGHGGTIAARSEVGVGSVFTVQLPAVPQTAAGEQAQAFDAEEQSPQRPR